MSCKCVLLLFFNTVSKVVHNIHNFDNLFIPNYLKSCAALDNFKLHCSFTLKVTIAMELGTPGGGGGGGGD